VLLFSIRTVILLLNRLQCSWGLRELALEEAIASASCQRLLLYWTPVHNVLSLHCKAVSFAQPSQRQRSCPSQFLRGQRCLAFESRSENAGSVFQFLISVSNLLFCRWATEACSCINICPRPLIGAFDCASTTEGYPGSAYEIPRICVILSSYLQSVALQNMRPAAWSWSVEERAQAACEKSDSNSLHTRTNLLPGPLKRKRSGSDVHKSATELDAQHRHHCRGFPSA
jgi:hypothetical protein